MQVGLWKSLVYYNPFSVLGILLQELKPSVKKLSPSVDFVSYTHVGTCTLLYMFFTNFYNFQGQNGKQTEGKAQKRKTPEDTVEFSIDRKASKVPSLCAEKPHFAAKIQTKGAKLKRLRKPRKL